MAVTIPHFKQDFPQFCHLPNGDIERALTRAALRINSAIFGDLYDEAHGALAAHYLALGQRGNIGGGDTSGPVKRRRIDGWGEVEYEDSTESSYGLESTVYGQQFLEIQRIKVLPVRIY